MSTRTVEIEIDHLVLLGIDPRHRDQIAEAVRRELAELVDGGGLPPHWGEEGGSVQGAPRIEVAPGETPARIGASVARAIYRGET
jgi:hypothetical protein